jgi:hypothetical protein
MVICMMLCLIHAALTDNSWKFGPIKLRGVHAQFMRAIALGDVLSIGLRLSMIYRLLCRLAPHYSLVLKA